MTSESKKMLVDLTRLAQTLSQLLRSGVPGNLIPELLQALAADGELPEGRDLIGQTVDRWRGNVLNAMYAQDNSVGLNEYDEVGDILRAYNKGPNVPNAEWEERLRRAIDDRVEDDTHEA